jgi:spore maturation protein CgeB
VADVHNGLVKGLVACLGADNVRAVNYDDRLDFFAAAEIRRNGIRKLAFDRETAIRVACRTIAQDLYEFWPDVLIVVSGFFITPFLWAVLGRRPHHTVAWFTESPYEDDRQLQVARYVDTAILNDPTNIQTFRATNPRTYYFPHSYDPDVHAPGPAVPPLACDFGWVGTAFPSRIEFFRQVDWAGVDAKFAGNWQALDRRSRLARFLVNPKSECMNNTETVDLYRSCKLSANIYRKETSDEGTHRGWAAGPREIELAACGTFMLREARPEGDELFPDAPIFSEPGEFSELLHWWLAHDDLRQKTAQANREAIADRTFTNTAARLLELIDGAPKRIY